MNIIITGIHTGIGKTICSAVICQALGYDYWKPVQAGDLENSDSIFIKKNVSNPACILHAETYRLPVYASPHFAAAEGGIVIKPEDFILPCTDNSLVIETAGGIMSPLASNFLNIDLIMELNQPVIVVSNNYLGSISHTLLTVAALQQRHIPIEGLVFSGAVVESTRQFILEHTRLPLLFSIPLFEKIDRETIAGFVKTVAVNL
jgi:dethiobiotin synthetase